MKFSSCWRRTENDMIEIVSFLLFSFPQLLFFCCDVGETFVLKLETSSHFALFG